jgi:hypothetical protein
MSGAMGHDTRSGVGSGGPAPPAISVIIHCQDDPYLAARRIRPPPQHAVPSFQVVIVMLPTSQRTQRRLDIPRLYLVKRQLPRALWKTACIDTITSSSGAEALLSPRLPRSIAKARSIAKDRVFEAVRALSTVNHAIQVSLSGDSRSPDRTP